MNAFRCVLMLCAVLSVAGCKKKGGGGEALAKMETFQKSMCDCKDSACADKVNDEMAKWGAEMAKNAKPGDAEKPDPEMAKKSADVMQKYTECMTKLKTASAPKKEPAPPPPSTAVATIAALDAIALPTPKGAPEKYKWLAQESTKEGNRLAYFGEGTTSWLGVQIVDCNLPRMLEDAKKASGGWADAGYCRDKYEGKLKDYPLYTKYDSVRAVKAGHLVVVVSASTSKMKAPELEEFLGTIDLAAIAKL